MKIATFNDRMFWLAARQGKITGTRVKDLWSPRQNGKKKIGFYALIAEKLGIPSEEVETPMERGQRLQADAIARFEAETKLKVNQDLVLWIDEENANLAVSPDGMVILKGKKAETEAVEVKCLSAARHIEAYITQEVPDEYELQILQYFIVNPKLRKVHMVFYDPRFSMNPKAHIDYFVIEVKRTKEIDARVKEMREFERSIMEEVNEWVNKITF